MEIVVKKFSGAVPALAPRLIPDDSVSSFCVNADTRTGQLRGWRASASVHSFPPDSGFVKAVRLKNEDTGEYLWYGLEGDKSEVLPSPLVNDAYNRFYLFEQGQPAKIATWDQIDSGAGFANLGFSAPSAAPSASVGGASTQPLLAETRAYVIAYVSEWGEESNISAPVLVTVEPTQTVTLGAFYPGTPTIAGRAFAYVRIYRTVIGENTVDYYKVADVAWGVTTFLDDKPSTQVVLNSILMTQNDNLPDGYYGARVHPSGAMMAFRRQTLRFSVPYLPHAWPDDYALAFQDNIVAIEVFAQNVLVFTTSGVSVVYGAAPGQLGITTYPISMPCRGYNTVVATPQGVLYVTLDGVAMTNGGPPTVFSQDIIARDQWRRAFAQNAYAVYHNGFYLAVASDGTGFCLDLAQGTYFTEFSFAGALNFKQDAYNGVTYALRGDNVLEFDPASGARLPYQWRSKDFHSALPVDFAAIEVDFDHMPPEGISDDSTLAQSLLDKSTTVLVRVWADGELIFSQPMERRVPLPLPAGAKRTVWTFEVCGYCPLHYVAIAESMAGLQNV